MDTKRNWLQNSSGSLTPQQTQALQNYLPEVFVPKIKAIRTVEQLLQQPTSSLTKIKKNIGPTRTEALIKVYLVRLNELLDLKKPLSETAIDEIANILVQDYYYLTMHDVVFVLQRAVKGDYGEMYESLSIPKVLKWFALHFEERCQTAAQMSLKEHSSHNSLFGRERSSDRVNEQKEFSRQYAMNKKRNSI